MLRLASAHAAKSPSDSIPETSSSSSGGLSS